MNSPSVYTSSNAGTGSVQRAAKRVFDIAFAGTCLLILSPVLALVAILIRIESRGPAFYFSNRVGSGYRIFRLIKFRTMYTGSDAKLAELSHLNAYAESPDQPSDPAGSSCKVCKAKGEFCSPVLYTAEGAVCERQHLLRKKASAKPAFSKFKKDPRITPLGRILRNTSVDELPQLINVLLGHMSLVGNRPLPLYEAEKLTVDEHSLRFMAPAGITGLWQVTKRGKSDMSDAERKDLDNHYALNWSVWLDLRIIFLTFPALLQTEDV